MPRVGASLLKPVWTPAPGVGGRLASPGPPQAILGVDGERDVHRQVLTDTLSAIHCTIPSTRSDFMPDKLGKLDAQEISKLKDWFAKKVTEPCAGCGKRQFGMGNHVVMLGAEVKNVLKAHSYYPALMVICSHCARIQLYSALRVGIDSSQSDSDTEAQDA